MEFTCPQGELYKAKKGAPPSKMWIVYHMTHDWQYLANLRMKHANPKTSEFVEAIEKHREKQADRKREEAFQAKADFLDDCLRGGV